MIRSRNLSVVLVAAVTYAGSVAILLWRSPPGGVDVSPPASPPRRMTAAPAPAAPQPLTGMPAAPAGERDRSAASRAPAVPAPAAAADAAPAPAADPNAIPRYTPVAIRMTGGREGEPVVGHLRNLSDKPLQLTVREESRATRQAQEISVALAPNEEKSFSRDDGLELADRDRILVSTPPLLARTTYIP